MRSGLKLNIREATAEEIAPFQGEEWARYDGGGGVRWDSRRYRLAAVLDGRIVGIAVYHVVGGVGHLDQLLVGKDYRGQGIGSQLLAEFERRCRAAGCHKLTLETAEYQAQARRLYEEHGFKIACTLHDNKFHRDWYLMEKGLGCSRRS